MVSSYNTIYTKYIMTDFIDNHTNCACGEKVFPG